MPKHKGLLSTPSSTRHLIFSNDNRIPKVLVVPMKIKEETIQQRSTHARIQV